MANGNKFRFWCQKVLPLVYDQSLSYYEVLCKVVEYVNGIKEDFETLAEQFDDAEGFAQDAASSASDSADSATAAADSASAAADSASAAADSASDAADSASDAANSARIAANYISSTNIANTAAEMVDTDKIYVYCGNETGYVFGNWYYYNGASWSSGGIYNSPAYGKFLESIFAEQPNVYNGINVVNKAFSGNTGTIVDAQGYRITDFIPFKQDEYIGGVRVDDDSYDSVFSDPYPTGATKIAVYNSDKVWQSTTGWNASTPYPDDKFQMPIDGYIRLQYARDTKIKIFKYFSLNIKSVNTREFPVVWAAVGDSIVNGRYSYIESDIPLTGTTENNMVKIANTIKGFNPNMLNISEGGIGYVHENALGHNLDYLITQDMSSADLITVQLGHNDLNSSYQLGNTQSAIGDGTISGNIRKAIVYLCNKYPEKIIAFIAPLNSCEYGNANTGWDRTSAPIGLNNITNMIKYWCEFYGVYFINSTIESPINGLNIETLLPDKVHPSLNCHKLLGEYLATQLPI